MMSLVAILLLIIYVFFLAMTVGKINEGKLHYLLVYMVIFFPVYIVFLSFIYANTESIVLTRFVQYSKEMVLFYGIGVWWLGQKKLPLIKQWQMSRLDSAFILFGILTLIFFLLPIGEATLLSKATYIKNILLMFVAYFFGRNVTLSFYHWKYIFKAIFGVSILALLVVLGEHFFGLHFHSLIGYSRYYSEMLNIDPTGNYGLNWTFEAQGGLPRYGSFFANPLELSASMLITASLSVALFLWVPNTSNKYKYIGLLLAAVACVFLAYSRATFVSFFFTFIFVSFLLCYYRILKAIFGFGLAVTIYILFFAAEEVRYFAIDTLLFQNSSSLTHLADWLEGINSMIENPLGIGLAMSGNAGGVDDSLRIGGENQFLVYGVQLGLIGMLLYMYLLFLSIRHCWVAVRSAKSREEQIVPLVGASVKFGLLLPLLTSNAEVYLYVSLVSWWFVGAGESIYQKYREPQHTYMI